MNLLDTLSLFLIMLALAAVPSTSVALVVTRSAMRGLPHGAAVSAGIVVGDLIFVLLAILGLAAISELLGSLFLLIRYIAALYLIWLGIALIRGRKRTVALERRDSGGGLLVSFLSGLLLTLGDLKAIFFYASLFPVFVDVPGLVATDMAVIALITIASVAGVKLAYAVGATRVAALSGRFRYAAAAKLGAGGLMIGAGGYLILKP